MFIGETPFRFQYVHNANLQQLCGTLRIEIISIKYVGFWHSLFKGQWPSLTHEYRNHGYMTSRIHTFLEIMKKSMLLDTFGNIVAKTTH